jgi:hypothetical protein
MRSWIRRSGAAALVSIGLVAASAAAPASAITGGTPDGEEHPNVGLIAFYDSATLDANGLPTRFRCSATLVSDTVVLTAAHCTLGTVGKTLVTFESELFQAPNPDGSSPLYRAADPAVGYTQAELEAQGFYSGTAYAHPEYSDFTDLDNWNDVGVIVLDEPITDIVPATIAPANYLDAYAQPVLNKTIFTSVGYGTEVRKADEGPQKPTPMSYPLIRRYADSPGQKLTPQILQTNGNLNDNRGTGGTCFGDSGGPTFHGEQEYVVTVTSYGYTSNCRYLDGLQRVDIPVVQEWLATFGVTFG